MDVERELHAYEVEYHIFQEEMIYTPKKEGLPQKELEENRALRRQNMELIEQLQVSHNSVSRLEASVSSYQGTVRHLEDRIRALEDERDALLHSNAALRHRLERTEHSGSDGGTDDGVRAASVGATARSLSFSAAGDVHDGIVNLVRRIGNGAGEDEDWDEAESLEGVLSAHGQRSGCDGL